MHHAIQRSRLRARAVLVGSFALAGLLTACAGGAGPRPPEPEAPGRLTLEPGDRILVLAPHPDDEVLCCGGVLQEAVARGLPVRVVFLTYGDSNEWSFLAYRKRPEVTPRAARALGEVRRREALAAADRLGVPRDRLTFLGYPDHGTLSILLSHWGKRPPYRGPLTRARAVPYATALRPGAPYEGEQVLADLESVLRNFRPTKVFLPHPADHHPDHAALYLFARVALWDLAEGGDGAAAATTTLQPYLVHFPGWPRPAGGHPELALDPPRALAAVGRWRRFPLTEEQERVKSEALRAHRTQYGYSARRLLPFVRTNELFGNLPTVVLDAGDAPVLRDEEGRAEDALEVPEDLLGAVADHFVGLESLRPELGGDRLRLSVRLDQPLRGPARLDLFLLGYRAGRPFAAMPKLDVRVGEAAVSVFDRGVRRGSGDVEVRREDDGQEILVDVPRAALGDPDRCLLGAETSSDLLPLDRVSWRVLELPPPAPAPGSDPASESVGSTDLRPRVL